MPATLTWNRWFATKATLAMRSKCHPSNLGRVLLRAHLGLRFATAAVCLLLSACSAQIGPKTVPAARFDYSEAISQSWNEQLLLNLVRLRYRDTPTFVEVGQIVAQYTMTGQAEASSSLALGRGENRAGVAAGVQWDEKPTITYAPLQGEEFVRRLLSPIDATTLVLVSKSGWSLERLLLCCVNSLGGLENAPEATGPTPRYVPANADFQTLARMLRDLQVAGVLDIYTDPKAPESGPILDLSRAARGEASERVARVRTLLGLSQRSERFELAPPHVQADHVAVEIETRSLLGVLWFLSHAVTPPTVHEREGLVTVTQDTDGHAADWYEITGELLRIRSSASRPTNAFAAVHYRGYWFYIPDDDLNSKTTFGLLLYLFSLQSASGKGPSPLLTIPTR